MARCAAKTAKGERCKSAAVPGMQVCRVHGRGGGQKIQTTYSYVSLSQALPDDLRDLAIRATTDPNLLALNESIGALDARLVQLMRGLSELRGGKQAWREIRTLVDTLWEEVQAEDMASAGRTYLRIHEFLAAQFREHAIWDEIYNGMELRRKLVETEGKRRERAAVMITADQALVFMNQVALTVRRHVHDPAALRAISLELEQIAHPGKRRSAASRAAFAQAAEQEETAALPYPELPEGDGYIEAAGVVQHAAP